MSAPDLSPARTQAEAVAYGRLLATRSILDVLAHGVREPLAWPLSVTNRRDYERGYRNGYDRAVAAVKTTRCGVEKPEQP